MNYDITEKAMLASLHISCWSARKHDKQVSKEVDERYGGRDAGRFNKVLASKDALKTIQTVIGSARIFHQEQTLPWGERGERLLPSKNYTYYSRQMRIYKQAFSDAVNAFADNFHNVIFEAKLNLGGLFRKEDYPDANEIRDKFSFETIINPVPASDDFRVSLGQEEIDDIRMDLQKRMEASQAAANRDLWHRLYDVVAHMMERLSDPDAVFRDSLVGNIVRITELLPRLNLNDDPELDAMRRQIEESICAYSPEDLRKNKTIRRQAAGDARNILDAMAGYMEAA